MWCGLVCIFLVLLCGAFPCVVFKTCNFVGNRSAICFRQMLTTLLDLK
jgi:hypothetical protein